MAKIALDIPEDQVDRVVAAVCTYGGYDGPDTKKGRLAYVQRELGRHLVDIVVRVEAAQAQADAARTAPPDPLATIG